MLAGSYRRDLDIMKQDVGKKMVVIDTGKLVRTTGQRLLVYPITWIIQVVYKNGKSYWYKEKDLQDCIS